MDRADDFLRTAERLGGHLVSEAMEERASLETVGAQVCRAGVSCEDVELLMLQVSQARAVLSEATAST